LKILLCSICFHPSVGGIEVTSEILADEFTRMGSEVTLVTDTPSVSPDDYAFPVVRQPDKKRLLELGKQSDVIFQNNISLKTLIPLLRAGKPVVVTTQTWLTRTNGSVSWQDRLKKLVLRLVHNVAISEPIAKTLPKPSTIIHNPFQMRLFYPHHDEPKKRDIVFVGRLVSDKGCDLILKALAILKNDRLTPSFTVIGDGPERATLEAMTAELGLSGQVRFLGNLRESRALEMARHAIMVVPSIWAEPFGIVALEGIATGCAMIVSERGGLPEAVGKCGLLFPNGDVPALAAALRMLLTDNLKRQELVSEGEEHLKGFSPPYIAERYMEVFRKVTEKRA